MKELKVNIQELQDHVGENQSIFCKLIDCQSKNRTTARERALPAHAVYQVNEGR